HCRPAKRPPPSSGFARAQIIGSLPKMSRLTASPASSTPAPCSTAEQESRRSPKASPQCSRSAGCNRQAQLSDARRSCRTLFYSTTLCFWFRGDDDPRQLGAGAGGEACCAAIETHQPQVIEQFHSSDAGLEFRDPVLIIIGRASVRSHRQVRR